MCYWGIKAGGLVSGKFVLKLYYPQYVYFGTFWTDLMAFLLSKCIQLVYRLCPIKNYKKLSGTF